MNINSDIEKTYCFVPENINDIDVLCATPSFIAPSTVDLRDYCTPTDNQGQYPFCAGYTAANYAENLLWRKFDYPQSIDAAKIYNFAKTIDGFVGDGTTLTAVASALLNYKIFPGDKTNIKVINKNNINDIKYAIHKYGCLMTAFNISEDWYSLNKDNYKIDVDKYPGKYGHAMLACGYNRKYLILQNSWGQQYGHYGFVFVSWEVVQKQFLYACSITSCLDGIR